MAKTVDELLKESKKKSSNKTGQTSKSASSLTVDELLARSKKTTPSVSTRYTSTNPINTPSVSTTTSNPISNPTSGTVKTTTPSINSLSTTNPHLNSYKGTTQKSYALKAPVAEGSNALSVEAKQKDKNKALIDEYNAKNPVAKTSIGNATKDFNDFTKKPEKYSADNLDNYHERASYLASKSTLTEDEKKEIKEILTIAEKSNWGAERIYQ